MDFDLSITSAWTIAMLLPILAVCIAFFLIPIVGKGGGSKLRRYLSYLITPPISNPDDSSWRTDKIRLFFFYLGVGIFLTNLVIGGFYEVMIDLLLPVTQGSTGEMRIATSVTFQNLLTVEWLGTLPWIGVNAYHQTWDWIFFTAAFTDNPVFLGSLIPTMTLLSIGVGLVFLAPLAIKRIRQAFLPSIFFFMTGMTIFTKTTTSCLAYAIALFFGNAELEYITITATGAMIPGLSNVILIGVPIFLAMLVFFILFGHKLWKIHYEDSKTRTWFTVYITLSLFLGLFLTIIMV